MCLLFAVEIFATASDFHVIQAAHNISQPIVQKAEQKVRVLLDVEHLDLLDTNAVVSGVNLESLNFR